VKEPCVSTVSHGYMCWLRGFQLRQDPRRRILIGESEALANWSRKQVKGFTPLAMDRLLKYDWPGNVRELENVVERAVILVSGDYITETEFPVNLTRSYAQTTDATPPQTPSTHNHSLDEVEREVILATLKAKYGVS
jgi:two-component system response regulator HydG